MVEAVIWMTGLSILLIFLMVPVTVHLLRDILVDEDGTEPDHETGVQRQESSSTRGGAGT